MHPHAQQQAKHDPSEPISNPTAPQRWPRNYAGLDWVFEVSCIDTPPACDRHG